MHLSRALFVSMVIFDNSLFHFSSAARAMAWKSQWGISASILANAFSGLTGEIPHFNFSVEGGWPKLINPLMASPLPAFPSSRVSLLYTLNWLTGSERRMAKNNNWSLAHPFERRQ